MFSRYLNPHHFGAIRHLEEQTQLNVSSSGQDTLLECLPPSHFAPGSAPLTATAQPIPKADGRVAGCCTRPRFARPDHGVPCGDRITWEMPRKKYQVTEYLYVDIPICSSEVASDVPARCHLSCAS